MSRGKRLPETGAPSVRWHALSEDDLFQELRSAPEGLDEADVLERRREHGPNTLPVPEPPTLLAIVLHQFKSPLIYILLAAAAVAIAVGDFTDAAFIGAVVLLNAGLGAFQEFKAERSAAGLQKLLKVQSRVRRAGKEAQVSAEELVPGDVVLLESGNKVPADLRLLQVKGLAIDESFLTGESMAVEKQSGVLSEDIVVAERKNIAFAGSTVTSGRGLGMVVETGLRTEVGRIAETVAAEDTTKPPLLIRMERFARQISFIVLGACALLAIVAVAKGMPALDVFFLAVALSVSAIPEGLPVAITVALSVATSRMASRNVIVRRLAAVEGLGSCTYIASDKTGTLTVNEQTVKLVWLASGETYRASGEGYSGEGHVENDAGAVPSEDDHRRLSALASAAILCNEATLSRENEEWKHAGDAVDVALLAFAHKLGMDPQSVRRQHGVVGEIPFESERSYAATFVRDAGGVKALVKGALEVILPRCEKKLSASGIESIDRNAVESKGRSLSESGYRVIAVAEGSLGADDSSGPLGEESLPPLVLLGLVGLIDPPRPEAKDAVAKCQGAGIRVGMITGDHPLTAFAIARELGITDSKDRILTGKELEAMGSVETPAYQEAVESARVFARVSPLQKLDIVDALVRLGHFVAVTGDGVNDAPALRKGNIGVAMGSGTDITKDTASIIVTDDNFASIEAGVEEGRFAYDNIRKVTALLISTGAAEVLLFLLALLTGMPLPLLPAQILWLNLVTNGIQDVALAFEGGEPGSMSRPPRKPTEGIFNRLMVQQTMVAGLTMGVMAYIQWRLLLSMGWGEEEARNRLLLLMVFLQNFHAFNCRSERQSAFRVPLRRNPIISFGVLGALLIHVGAMHLPLLQGTLRISPIAKSEWVFPFLIASSVLIAMELFKRLQKKER
jgi:magnesium-transporting ATPase (P-type)